MVIDIQDPAQLKTARYSLPRFDPRNSEITGNQGRGRMDGLHGCPLN
jgi:hypothetical protein